MLSKVLFSSKSDHLETPKEIYNFFKEKGYIDPCPLNEDYDKPLYPYRFKYLFINPPYSKIDIWVDYVIERLKDCCSIALLVPARTDTARFHRLLGWKPRIYFIKGRLNFSNKGSAPFPSLLVYFSYGWTSGFYYSLDKDFKELEDKGF